MKAADAWTTLAEGHVRGNDTKRKAQRGRRKDAKRRQERRLEYNRNVKRCGWVREEE